MSSIRLTVIKSYLGDLIIFKFFKSRISKQGVTQSKSKRPRDDARPFDLGCGGTQPTTAYYNINQGFDINYTNSLGCASDRIRVQTRTRQTIYEDKKQGRSLAKLIKSVGIFPSLYQYTQETWYCRLAQMEIHNVLLFHSTNIEIFSQNCGVKPFFPPSDKRKAAS